ncbi:unnamed protein product, partial [Rotaria sordida]
HITFLLDFELPNLIRTTTIQDKHLIFRISDLSSVTTTSLTIGTASTRDISITTVNTTFTTTSIVLIKTFLNTIVSTHVALFLNENRR